MATTADEYTINAVQAADLLDVHPSTISRRIERGDMPGEIEGEGKGRNVRVPAIAVLRVLAHDDVKREARNAATLDFSRDMRDVCEQSQRVRDLWRDAFDHAEGDKDGMDRFDEISDALDELADRVQSAQASKRLIREAFM